jgi:glycosyltransferase involved in cell wall biosynthesis
MVLKSDIFLVPWSGDSMGTGARPRTSSRDRKAECPASSFCFSMTYLGGRPYSKKRSVPYVLSPRGMLVKDLIARRSRFAKSAWIHLIERSNVERAAALHLTSPLEGAELERFGWRLPRLAVIPNAIDEPLSQNGEIASDVETIISEQSLVLFFGRLSWKKGLDSCIRLYPSWITGYCRHRR